MAFRFIQTITKSGFEYALYYDPTTDTFDPRGGTSTTLPDTDLPEGYVMDAFCVDTTKYIIHFHVVDPFGYSEIIANSPDCGYIDPTPPPPPPPPDPGTTPPIYRGLFSNIEQGFLEDATAEVQTVAVFIVNKRSIVDGVISESPYVDFTCSGDPLRISIIDSEESKFSPIQAKQARFQFNSTNEVDSATFAGGEDDEWKMYVQVKDQVIFQGFVVVDEISESFNFAPNVVTLTATDNLGLLKDVPLTDFTGVAPKWNDTTKWYYKVINYIAWALSKTGLQLDIFVNDNLFEESYPNLPAFDNIYINFKTFEGQDVGICENCYSVLTKILGDEYRLTQWQNSWYITRVDEYQNDTFSMFRFDWQGGYINQQTGVDWRKFIAESADNTQIRHSEEQSDVKYQRTNKSIQEKFIFEYPKELIDNFDFSRGSWLSPVPVPDKSVKVSDVPLTYQTWNGKAYNAEDWTYHSDVGGGSAYIIRYFYLDDERERYLSFFGNGAYQSITAHRIPIFEKDKFSISVDMRLNTDYGSSGFYRVSVMWVILYGDDGSVWALHGGASYEPNPKWYNTSQRIYIEGDLSDNLTDWKTSIGGDAPPAPVNGELEVRLERSTIWSDETHFSNFRFDYTPFIAGTYIKYTGQQHSVTNNLDFKSVREQQVYISDAPRPLMKGALEKFIDSKWILTGRWYNGAVFPGGLPADIYLNSRGRTQAFSVWNQYNRVFRILDSALQGLQTTTDIVNYGMPDTVHLWVMADDTQHTNNKRFLLIHYEMDFNLCAWKGYFIEVFDTTITKDYASQYEFKYLRQ